jgi:NRPS condensation-like uncharacterized protein
VSTAVSAIGVRLATLSAEKLRVLETLWLDRVSGYPRRGTIPRRPDPSENPLSFIQEQLWLQSYIEPQDITYNRPVYLQLNGPLNLACLERAINSLVSRHDVLRSSFPIEDGLPQQIIRPWRNSTLPFRDLTSIPPPAIDSHIQCLKTSLAAMPFDLANGPLMRTLLIRIAEERHVLLIVFHHIVFDAQSNYIFNRDLAELYRCAVDNRANTLKSLAIQYRDYASWQRKIFAEGFLAHEVRYWTRELLGSAPAFHLNVARSRPLVGSRECGTLHTLLPRNAVANLKVLASQFQFTPAMVLFAAFKLLLFRHSEQTDLVVGMPVTGRLEAETTELIGCFINTLAIRTAISSTDSAHDILSSVRQKLLCALQHQRLPFAKMVEAVRPRRRPNCSPIFQIAFNYRNILVPDYFGGGLHFIDCPFRIGAIPYDLVLEIIEREDEFGCVWRFRIDLFDTPDIEQMCTEFRVILEAMFIKPLSAHSVIDVISDFNQSRSRNCL